MFDFNNVMNIATAPELILGLIVVWNIIVFVAYASDKRRSYTRRRRISERALLFMAFMAGGMGALFAMLIMRHKTKKMAFKILVPLFFVLQILGILLLFEFVWEWLV